MRIFRRKDFWGTAARALRATLFLLIVMQFLEYRGLLAGPEGAVLDRLLRRSPADPASGLSPVITVEIDDAAYRACFDPTSPLDPNVVVGLVKGVNSAERIIAAIWLVATPLPKPRPDYQARLPPRLALQRLLTFCLP